MSLPRNKFYERLRFYVSIYFGLGSRGFQVFCEKGTGEFGDAGIAQDAEAVAGAFDRI